MIDVYILSLFKYLGGHVFVCVYVSGSLCLLLVAGDLSWFLAGLCGQEEPLLAFRTGKYALCGHSPTSQPGNGSRESQGKTSRQSGRGEKEKWRQIVVLSYFVYCTFILLYYYYILFISYTCFPTTSTPVKPG